MIDFQLTHYIVFNDDDLLFVINNIFDKFKLLGIIETKGEFCSLIEENDYIIFEKRSDQINKYPAIVSVIPNYNEEVAKVCILPFKDTKNLNRSCLKNIESETNEKNEIINLIYKSNKDKFEYVKVKSEHGTDIKQKNIISKNDLILYIIKSKEIMIGYYDKETNEWKIEFSDNGYYVTTITL